MTDIDQFMKDNEGLMDDLARLEAFEKVKEERDQLKRDVVGWKELCRETKDLLIAGCAERDRYKAALEHELECCKCYTVPGECPKCKRLEGALKT